MNENIIDTARKNLRLLTGIKLDWTEENHGYRDGILQLTIDDHPVKLDGMIRFEYQIPQLRDLIKYPLPKQILIAQRFQPKQRELLRKNNRPYLEANGNMFFKDKNHHILIEGQPVIPIIRVAATNRAFARTGIKVVFNLLINPHWLNLPYRQLAEKTDTGIGNLTNIITGLKDQGFLFQVKKGELRFHDKKNLIHQWMKAYKEKLQPGLALGTFRFLDPALNKQWYSIRPNDPNTVWGGEPAGGLLTNYLQPQDLTLYTTEKITTLMRQFRMVPDIKGNIFLYEKFWTDPGVPLFPTIPPYKVFFDIHPEKATVAADDPQDPIKPLATAPPILVYADLMNTNDQRCIETAERVYAKYIQD